ncbi:MAG: hypothetical protein QW774_03220 [Candidatus Micrarchaeaceae archaeon]
MEKLKRLYKRGCALKHYLVYAIAGFSIAAPVAIVMYAFKMVLYGSAALVASVAASEYAARARLVNFESAPNYTQLALISLVGIAVFALYCAFVIS